MGVLSVDQSPTVWKGMPVPCPSYSLSIYTGVTAVDHSESVRFPSYSLPVYTDGPAVDHLESILAAELSLGAHSTHLHRPKGCSIGRPVAYCVKMYAGSVSQPFPFGLHGWPSCRPLEVHSSHLTFLRRPFNPPGQTQGVFYRSTSRLL